MHYCKLSAKSSQKSRTLKVCHSNPYDCYAFDFTIDHMT